MNHWAQWVWLNGKTVRAEAARVSVFDRSFLLGDGLFETLRVIEGRLFRLDRHLARLQGGAERVRLVLPYSVAEFTAGIQEIVRANELMDAAVRVTVSRGVGPAGPGLEGAGPPLCVIAARSFPGYPDYWYRPGARAMTSTIPKNERSPLAGIKTTSYLEHVLARAEAVEWGADEALLLNTRGHLVEGSSTNLFVVMAGRVHTPDAASGCLPGVTREAVIELARLEGLEIREEALSSSVWAAAAEAFLTNSLLAVAPLARVDGRKLGGDCPGPVTRLLAERYRELVERETV